MSPRVDGASVWVHASADRVYDAFGQAQALATWLPPEGMVGEMLAFDFVPGGGYRMRLTYLAPDGAPGKTAADADEIEVRFVDLVPNARIAQSVSFESEDAAYAGTMKMTWLLAPEGAGTRVTVRCEDVPVGIGAADHVQGLESTLSQLAAFVESRNRPEAA